MMHEGANSAAPALRGTIEIGAETARQFDRSSKLEWLETNGLGSFASGTVAGIHTRRYHGLLCGATQPPLGRLLLLSKLDDSICVAGRDMPLGTNLYRSTTVHPEGYRLIERFELAPWPVWTYDIFGLRVRREVLMPYERQGTLVRYAAAPGSGDAVAEALLRLRPMFAWRDYHAIERKSPKREIELEEVGSDEQHWRARSRGAAPDAPEAVTLHLQTSQPTFFTGEPFWYFDFSYPVEMYRGDPTREDLHSPGEFDVQFVPGTPFAVWAGLEPLEEMARGPGAVEELIERERTRRARLVVPAHPSDATACRLARAADQFIVRRGSGLSTVIAGYPWFTDWGRDTMIALPGLALATGRHDEARGILLTFARHMDKGVIPNRFPDDEERPAYNTVDATLWMFEAIGQYLAATGDNALLSGEGLLDLMVESVRWHLKGSHFGIQADAEDGLLRAGTPGTQLTWMDAKFDEEVFTPRHGKPVEINALWHSALVRLSGWLREAGRADEAAEFAALARRAADSFNARFWDAERRRLFDVVDRDGPGSVDAKMRPNQIFAVALEHSPLARERWAPVLEAVGASLLTPFGLRTLAPDEAGYHGVYGGDRYTRDSQYHRGPVWGWLIGGYVEAYLRVHGTGDDARRAARGLIEPLIDHLEEHGVGQMAEMFDGDAPHMARGCFAQAWTVAEVLRVAVKYDLL